MGECEMERKFQDKDYFSLNNLGRLSEVDAHLSYVEGIVKKYSEKNFAWTDVQQQIDFIRRKKNDKKLNISVIGEFSTGKSTFINALLRKELLVSSALQGTTVASTVIDYSDRHKIILEYLNGRSEKLYYNSFGELRKGLSHFTTNSSIAKQLKAVNVFLPADILKNDFRIIDTPGTNVTEAWHEDVTVRALKEKSDLSIILTSAERPVPDTMLSFVRKNLESILPQCVFVVTKLDTLRARERKQQLAYVKMKLEGELDIQEAVALPYVSPMVLCSEKSAYDTSTDDVTAETKRRICIVGGFGVGKKGLVEALLKGKLPDCFMRGASVADIFAVPVFKFAYAPEPVVKVKLKEPARDGDFLKCCPSSLADMIKKCHGVNLPVIEVKYEEFCDLMQNLKPYQDMSRDLSYGFFTMAAVYLPLDCLKNEYEITVCNRLEESSKVADEGKAAQAAATDMIMLLNATSTWSSEEKNFIQRCCNDGCGEKLIFAINRMDKVSQYDIARIKDYCRKQADTFAVLDSPICYISTDSEKFGISSLLDELAKKGSWEDLDADGDLEQVDVDDALLAMSLETEQKLIQHTANQRTLAVTKKLTQLIDDTYQSVSGQMEQISKDYERRLELLNRSRQADLSMFVRKEKGERLQCFDVVAKDLSDKAEQSAYANADAACAAVIGNLDDKDTTEKLKSYIDSSLSNDCRKQAENLISQTDFYYGRIQIMFRDEMKTFHDSFQKIYNSLDIIPLDMSHAKYNFPQKGAIETADIASTANYIASQLSRENTAFLGKTAAGAAIGTAIAPGIGTVVGGAIGFVLGCASVDKSQDQARQVCKDKLKPQLTNYYHGIAEKVVSAVDKYIRQMRSCLSDEIDEYLTRYRSEVDRQIAMENSRRFAINTQISDLQADMTGIQNHKKQLDSVIVQLNNFGRKE